VTILGHIWSVATPNIHEHHKTLPICDHFGSYLERSDPKHP
jgi:hypothetical protein